MFFLTNSLITPLQFLLLYLAVDSIFFSLSLLVECLGVNLLRASSSASDFPDTSTAGGLQTFLDSSEYDKGTRPGINTGNALFLLNNAL